MLKTVTWEELTSLLTQEHPRWDKDAIQQQAKEYAATMDQRLDPLLRQHLNTGETPNLRFGEFSVIQLQRLRKGTSYFTALTMMDAYMKDPENGRARILRR